MDWQNYRHLFHFSAATRELVAGHAVRIARPTGKARERLCVIIAERRVECSVAAAPLPNAGRGLRGTRLGRRVSKTGRKPRRVQP